MESCVSTVPVSAWPEAGAAAEVDVEGATGIRRRVPWPLKVTLAVAGGPREAAPILLDVLARLDGPADGLDGGGEWDLAVAARKVASSISTREEEEEGDKDMMVRARLLL